MPSRSLRRLELAAIVVAALLSLLFHLRLPSQLPSEADHRAAAGHIAKHARAGDVILLHPWWTERARLFAPEGVPVVGYLGSDSDPLTDHPRIWRVSQPRLPRADWAAFDQRFLPGRAALEAPATFGPIEVTLFENGRHRPLHWSATRDLGSPRVPVGWHEVRHAPRRCLTVVLAQSPGELSLGALPEGDELTLEAGFIWDSAFRRGTPVAVELEADGEPLLSLTLQPWREGLSQRTVAPFRGAKTAKLRVRTNEHANREVCLEVAVRGAPR